MSNFLQFEKISGYTGYKGYRSQKPSKLKASCLSIGLCAARLQQVTRGYIDGSYNICNLCNLHKIKKVTRQSPAKSLYLQAFSKIVTSVTSKFQINFILDNVSLLFQTKIVAALLQIYLLRAPLCKAR